MSTATLTQPVASPAIPAWVPASLYPLTLDQYEAMVDRGILGPRDRVHLNDGFLVSRMTGNDPHATADLLCGEALDRVIPPGWHIRPGKPIRIPGLSSKPEPDRSVVRGAVRDYARSCPESDRLCPLTFSCRRGSS
ncbi:MAG: hypothetical protein ACYC61_22765, partial [Isosphaeraceae bacterium]